jgi:Methyltransferase domain
MEVLEQNSNVKQHEYMFVEWSNDVNLESYDIERIVAMVKASGKKTVRIADIGGGIGKVASVLADNLPNAIVDVIDNSELAVRDFILHKHTNIVFDNFLTMNVTQKYDYIIFRTVLHHFVAENEAETTRLQSLALDKTREMLNDDGNVFVMENFYEGIPLHDFTGRMIFELTVMKATANLFRNLGANTAGEGVRFRSYDGWNKLFAKAKLYPQNNMSREEWSMPMWQRLPFMCKERYRGLVTLGKAA